MLSMQFRGTDQLMKRSMESRVKKTGVYSSQHRILMHLKWMQVEHQSNCTQVELAKKLEISPAAIAVSIKKLEKGGYIHREPDETDNRALQVSITEKGEQVVKQTLCIFRKMDEDMFAGFTDEELELLSGFLERMYRNLEEKKKMEEI